MAVVTQDSKYIYWAYADKGMKETEELYDLAIDSGEMQNLASRSGHEATLNSMRIRYDQHVDRWSASSVDYNNYRKYETIFDRNVSWGKKKHLYKKKKKKK